MTERCSICGKGAGFGVIFKCNNCSRNVCHRHEKEQFVKYDVPGIEGASGFTSFNYPTGEAVNKLTFKCYHCRTGNIPKDIGKKGLDSFDFLQIFIAISIIVIILLSIFAFLGESIGLPKEMSEIFQSICMIFFVIVIIIWISLIIFYKKKYKL